MQNTSTISYPVIGSEAKFYGYVIGLSIEPWNGEGELPKRLLVTFEYNGEQETWEAPDLELWKKLWGYLEGNGWQLKEADEWGYGKVWIQKTESGWHVDLP